MVSINKGGGGQGEKQQEKLGNALNCENHNSRKMKITIQEFSESQFKNDENHNSGMMKTTIQELPESQFKNDEDHNSRILKNETLEFPKSQSNKTDINKTEYSETEISETDFNDTDTGLYGAVQSNQSNQVGRLNSVVSQRVVPREAVEEADIYRQIIRENIGYNCFRSNMDCRMEDVDELVELMVDVMMMPDGSSLRIAKVDVPVAIVKNRFMKIDYGHIQYALECLQKNTTKVGNIKAYLLTTLYNTTLTISNYYQAEVNHDMYGGGMSE